MSIVTVHGPHTFGSKGGAQTNPGDTVTATVNPANGLIWTFTPTDASQPAANYDWAYTPAGGTPASPIVDTKSPVITFTAGTKTVTLTLNGVAQAPIVVTAVAGAAPKTMQQDEEPDDEGGIEQRISSLEEKSEEPSVDVGYDPAAHSVAEVEEYADEHPDQAQELLDAEVAGKNRSTLVTYLEGLVPFDPAEHTVTEVIGFAEENPELLDDVIALEKQGKERVTLISHLEEMREA